MEFQKSLWRGEFTRLDFTFEGRAAVVVLPREAEPGRCWLLKTEYFEAFQDMECAFVRRGWALGYLTNLNRWGLDEDMHAKRRFRDFLAAEFGLSERCVPVGMSCGGLHAVKLAAAHPEMVSALYLDAPVINLLSCPFGLGGGSDLDSSARQEALDALGLTMAEMIAYREHPLDMLPALIEHHVPAMLVWGDADRTVPFEENGLLLQRAYERAGVPLLVQRKPGCAHHPHGPADLDAAMAFLSSFG